MPSPAGPAIDARPNAFLQLIRPANVATALADVLAGYAVSGLSADARLASLLATTACLYAGGVVLNDVFDRNLDAVERPERPIPSGRISLPAAGFLGAGLLLLGVLAARAAGPAAGLVALATAASILLYNAWGKHQTFVGPVNMGLCRALNLLLGVAASPAALLASWPLGLFPLAYIAGVTVVSRGEVHGGSSRVATVATALVSAVVVGLAALAARASSPVAVFWALAVAAALGWRVIPAFIRTIRTPSAASIRAAVGRGVLSLVLVDAVIAAAYADIMHSVAVLATGIVAVRLARRFAVT